MPVSKKSIRNIARRAFIGVGHNSAATRYQRSIEWQNRKRDAATAAQKRTRTLRNKRLKTAQREQTQRKGVFG